MDLGLLGKNAVVTGAGRGLGESIAEHLSQEGAHVAIISRTKRDLDRVLGKIGGKEKGHYSVACDLTTEGMPRKAFSELTKKFGEVDILVNNLGGTLDIKDPFCSINDWRTLWRLNMEVAIEFNNLVIPAMKKKQWGRIVHISSISALENQGPVPYCSIKAALTAYNRAMGRVVSPDGIIMTSVLPGAVYTTGGYWDITSKTNPTHVEKYLQERMAIKRFGNPDEIANMVIFLCSQHASFCVGSTIPVDGGQGRCFF
jgi:3-oxoacyl-[acyl-carrier protein] reductase